MTTNLVLMKEDKEAEELGKRLGFDKTLFLEKDFVLVSGNNPKELLKEINQARKKNLPVIAKPSSEELLRFALEKTPASLVFGQELISSQDSLFHPRGSLDQVTCQIAKDKNKMIGFSFADILNSGERGKIIGRMMFNLKLCRKYKVKVFFGNFSEDIWEMRGSHDLRAFFEMLGGEGKEGLEF